MIISYYLWWEHEQLDISGTSFKHLWYTPVCYGWTLAFNLRLKRQNCHKYFLWNNVNVVVLCLSYQLVQNSCLSMNSQCNVECFLSWFPPNNDWHDFPTSVFYYLSVTTPHDNTVNVGVKGRTWSMLQSLSGCFTSVCYVVSPQSAMLFHLSLLCCFQGCETFGSSHV